MSGTAEIGRDIAGYRVESVLGQGGMATVYLARNPEGGVCALKVLSKELVGDDPAFATRFKREVQYAEALDHPHVLEVYDSGDTPDGSLFFAMQYVDGHRPQRVAPARRSTEPRTGRDDPRADSRRARRGARERAGAPRRQSAQHHRRERPERAARVPDGFRAGQAPATGLDRAYAGRTDGRDLPYAAPEEILAQDRDHRVDVYSLGCVLYEALVGAPPFVRERDIDVLYAHIADPRPSASEARPDLPPPSTR